MVAAMHSCGCSHARTATVRETMNGKTVWQAQVEVSKHNDHAKVKEAFAWGYKDGSGEKQYVAVLTCRRVCRPVRRFRRRFLAER